MNESRKPSNQSSDPSRQLSKSPKQSTESSRPPTVPSVHSTAPSITVESTIYGYKNPPVKTSTNSTLSPCIKYKFTTAVKHKFHDVEHARTTKTTKSDGSSTSLLDPDEWNDDNDRR